MVPDADGRFFKNRSWLRLEFPELIARTEADVGCSSQITAYIDEQSGPQTILEVGCVSRRDW
jgi:hypothetical protein